MTDVAERFRATDWMLQNKTPPSFVASPFGRWLRRSGAAHPRHGTAAGEHRTSDQVASWGRATQRELRAVRVAWGGDDSTGTREEESGDFSQDLDPATEPLLR